MTYRHKRPLLHWEKYKYLRNFILLLFFFRDENVVIQIIFSAVRPRPRVRKNIKKSFNGAR